MGVPGHLLPLEVTVVRPVVVTDAYGSQTYDYGAAATRTTEVRCWLEQQERSEPLTDGRAPLIQRWLLVTNHFDILGRDRIEHGSKTYEVDGEPEPVYTPAGQHHLEATLKKVDG